MRVCRASRPTSFVVVVVVAPPQLTALGLALDLPPTGLPFCCTVQSVIRACPALPLCSGPAPTPTPVRKLPCPGLPCHYAP